MASRLKEDERNERIIRNLLKLPENRRCINCNSLGPQYVCTNFSTFVCTACSGIHREFTHRVKSVSMAKFTPQEVSTLQGGGNASAKQIFLKEWDPQRNSLPDSSNIDRLRDFIKHVYVDRRFSGERNMEKPPRAMKGENDETVGVGGSRSPPYEDTMERRYGERPSSGGRSPGYSPDTRRDSDYKRSPARPEVINTWRREDRFGNGKKSEDRSLDGSSTHGSRSPNAQRDIDSSSPPIVRPVREILGDAVSPLRVIEPPKIPVVKSAPALTTQRTASSSSLASAASSPPPQIRSEASFIDFDSVPEPSITEPTPQAKQAAADSSSLQPVGPSDNNWANFDSVPAVKSQTPPKNSNSVESMLSALSVPAPAPNSSAPVSTPQPLPSSVSHGSLLDSSFVPPLAQASSVIPQVSRRAAPQNTNDGPNLFANTHSGGQWRPMEPQQHSVFAGGVGQLPVSQVASANVGSASNQQWNAPVAARPAMPPVEAEPKSGGRIALPEDLFTMSYNYAPQVWYPGAPYAGGMHMHYNMPMQQTVPVPNFQQVSRSTNPFDFGHEPSAQASAFPSVASLQGALRNTMNTPPSFLPSHPAQPYASATPPSSFVGQGMASGNIPRPSGFGLDHNQQLGGAHTSNSSFGSGNPFG